MSKLTINQSIQLAAHFEIHSLTLPFCCDSGEGRLQLSGRHELELEEDNETGETKVLRYHHHKRLRVLPQQFVRKVKVRISQDDN